MDSAWRKDGSHFSVLQHTQNSLAVVGDGAEDVADDTADAFLEHEALLVIEAEEHVQHVRQPVRLAKRRLFGHPLEAEALQRLRCQYLSFCARKESTFVLVKRVLWYKQSK